MDDDAARGNGPAADRSMEEATRGEEAEEIVGTGGGMIRPLS